MFSAEEFDFKIKRYKRYFNKYHNGEDLDQYIDVIIDRVIRSHKDEIEIREKINLVLDFYRLLFTLLLDDCVIMDIDSINYWLDKNNYCEFKL